MLCCVDADLKLFAHCSEGNVETAKRLLFNFYSIRLIAFDSLFKERDIDNDALTTTRSLL